jgi:group I intron endonuclease
MKSGIYKIESPSGNFYVGSSKNIEKRWREHTRDLNRGRHHNTALQRAADCYGIERIKFCIIEECDESNLIAREQHHIDSLKPKYNIAKIAGNPALLWVGRRHKEETKAKISASHRAAAYEERYTVEVRSGMSRSAKIRSNSEEGRERLRLLNLGRRHTDETRLKMSESRQGEGSNTAKLTNSDVIDIKRILATRRGEYGLIPELARKYGVKTVTIGAIAVGRTWKHITLD